ncbi:hypothetical protein IEO21_00246 [Rhodonia placenta]|uniref:Uncharacterized protein n=1 Tax=Rhodonia placenta TaxID=104341 RepID=A0A8H7U688_9APHY|nr:hypothetical protein IEO21_00246 [Postia placenta]
MRPNMQRFWTRVPLSGKLQLFWERVTLSRITTIYFIFSVLHFAIQLGLQIQAFVVNDQAAIFLSDLVELGNASQSGFVVYTSGALHMCDNAPSSMNADSCDLLWMQSSGNTTANLNLQYALNSSASSPSAVSSILPSSSVLVSTASTTPSSIISSSSVLSSVLSSSSVASSIIPSSAPIVSSLSDSSIATSSASSVLSTPASTTSHAASVLTAAPSSTARADVPATDDAKVQTVLTSTHLVTVTLKVTATPGADAVRASAAVPDDVSTAHDVQQHRKRHTSISEQVTQNNGQTEVKVNGVPGAGEVTLDQTCLQVLNWPVSQLQNTKREDITFIMFQFWLLGMSLVALLNESIPHVVASLLTHVGATAWGGFQIYDTSQFHDDFTTLTTGGACGVNLLPTYWQARANAEIPSLALNGAALLLSAVLSWRLIKSFGWQTFKRVGASRTINRIYNVVLVLSISIQVALFFIAVAASLWLDQLINGKIGHMTSNKTLFEAIDIAVLVVLIPWLSMGWIAVRREKRVPMLLFLIIAFLYLGGWGSMFIAPTFRWTFLQWRFFSIMASVSVLLALVTLSLGIVCRVNFGKGLPRYLNAQEPLPDDDFLPTVVDSKLGEDVEKAAFPSNDLPIPTYNSFTFGSQQAAAPPSPTPYGPRQLGPRFFNSNLEPFEPQPGTPPVYSPRADISVMSSRTAVGDSQSLKRSESNISDASSMQSRRWVIE